MRKISKYLGRDNPKGPCILRDYFEVVLGLEAL